MGSQQQELGGWVLGRKGSDEWYTPQWIFDALKIEFDLDPCAPLRSIPWIPASNRFTKIDNGLARSWAIPPRGEAALVWLNPPYGKQTGAWVRKLIRHGEGVALTFARTDVSWFQEALLAAWNACFIAGRVNFVDEKGKVSGHAPAPSVLLAYGLRAALAVEASGIGVVVSPSGRLGGQRGDIQGVPARSKRRRVPSYR